MSNRYLVLEHYDSGRASVANGGDGSLSYLIYDNDGNVRQAKTNLGIEEYPAGGTDYRISVPATWSGVVEWYLGASLDTIASERFDVLASPGFFGPTSVTIRFVDANGDPVSSVAFVIAGVGVATTNNTGQLTVGLAPGSYTLVATPAHGVVWPTTTFTVTDDAHTLTVRGNSSAGETPPVGVGTGRYIRLTRSEIKEVNHYHIRGYRVRVDASDAVGMPNEVFVYARHPPHPVTGEVVDEFLTVASFPDLAEYPANMPDANKGFPFLRKSFIELDVRSTKDADDIWRLVVELVCSLRAALNRADNLVVAESVDCGSPPQTESESASISASV